MSGHTKGPWTLHEVGDRLKYLCPAKDDMSLLTLALEYHDGEDEPHEFAAVHNPADAHLIAAAPELLEAVKTERKYIFEALGRHDDAYQRHPATELDRAVIQHDLDSIDALIAKAEGKAVPHEPDGNGGVL